MTQQVKKETVKLEAPQDVEIAPEVILPAGIYSAERRQSSVPPLKGGRGRASPRYLLEYDNREHEVSELVRQGTIRVTL